MPSSARRRRCAPSQENGRVTTATVRAPWLRAISATTGPAPVPVPPPMPAATKTMSASFRISESSSRLSSAACRPFSGLPPEPRPRVTWLPIRTMLGASVRVSAWASVLMQK